LLEESNKNSTPIGVDIKGAVGFLKRIDQPFPFTRANRANFALFETDSAPNTDKLLSTDWHGHCKLPPCKADSHCVRVAAGTRKEKS